MLLQFSCLRNARHRGTSSMLKSIICLLMLSSSLLAQTPPSAETIKKDVQTLQNAANEAVNGVVTFGRVADSQGNFSGWVWRRRDHGGRPGAARNPFTAMKTSGDVKTIVTQKRKALTDKLTNLLKEKVPALESIGPSESATIIVYLLNANRGDSPDLPAQLVLTLKKQDAAAGTVKLSEYR